MRKKIGTITEAERDEIQHLNYRRQTLATLFRSMAEAEAPCNSRLFEQLISEIAETQMRYDMWFKDKAKHYNWESESSMSWSIDFETCDVFLIAQNSNASPLLVSEAIAGNIGHSIE